MNLFTVTYKELTRITYFELDPLVIQFITKFVMSRPNILTCSIYINKLIMNNILPPFSSIVEKY